MVEKKSPLMTKRDLRVVSISLSILSIGFAIAYGGLALQTNSKKLNHPPVIQLSPTPTPTPHQKI